MKWLIVVTVLLQAAPNEPLVGRWDAEVRSRGGLGTWMTLSAAHTLNAACTWARSWRFFFR